MSSLHILATTAFLSLLGFALAGNAIVQNNCGFDVFVQTTASNAQITISAGTSFSEAISADPTSIKISATSDESTPVQFEYANSNNELFYDISFINCQSDGDTSACAGASAGVTLVPSATGCDSASCPGGTVCDGQAFFNADDDAATKACSDTNTDLTFTLCSG